MEPWTVQFLAALAEEAEAGTELLRVLEREWIGARSAVRQEFDFTDLDNWMRKADQAIRRAQVVLDQLSAAARSTPDRSDPA